MSYIRTKEHRELMSKIKMGSKHSEETKKKMRKPKKLTKEFLNAQKERGKKKRGKNHPKWKGKEAGYNSKHDFIRRRKLKPKFCEKCGKNKPVDLANISGEYKREVSDYWWLCRKCHYHYDRDKNL